jgi:hypothetical protein
MNWDFLMLISLWTGSLIVFIISIYLYISSNILNLINLMKGVNCVK